MFFILTRLWKIMSLIFCCMIMWPIDGISIVNLTNSFAKMGNDDNQQALPQDPLQVSIRLIKRSRAKKNKETLNGFIRDI